VKTITIRFCIALAALVVVTAISFINTQAVGVYAEQTFVIQGWRDDFTSPILDGRWYWVREDYTHWSLTEQPGYLQITTQPGDIYYRSNTNDGQNILLTPFNEPVFQISSKVSFSPGENFHTAGILVYQDDDNYVFLSRVVVNGDQRIRFYAEKDGDIDFVKDMKAFTETATTYYCRITKRGNLYIGQYSLDGSNWIEVHRVHANLDNLSVGMMANNGTTTIELPANFDYFELRRVPPR
jgi:beta-xylosidase